MKVAANAAAAATAKAHLLLHHHPPYGQFLTIDSSLNNHYSQLDMKWVDPAVLLITQSISGYKIPVSSPEGSMSKKSATLTESQEIMILAGQPVQEEHTPLLDSSLYT